MNNGSVLKKKNYHENKGSRSIGLGIFLIKCILIINIQI